MSHRLTNAFFTAMLFWGAGSVIHGMHHEQDMRNYGGLRKKLPYTFWAMMIGTLAITGVGIPLTHYGFAGFLSKDAGIERAYAGTLGGYAFWRLVSAAMFTRFYSWGLVFLTFFVAAYSELGQSKRSSSANASFGWATYPYDGDASTPRPSRPWPTPPISLTQPCTFALPAACRLFLS